eukprot:2033635-Pyramimonas_sp.AAC.1
MQRQFVHPLTAARVAAVGRSGARGNAGPAMRLASCQRDFGIRAEIRAGSFGRGPSCIAPPGA